MPLDHLVVMAAGRGARMDPLTRTRPKVLLPVADLPLMGHVLREARSAGFRRATVIVHHGAKQVQEWLGDGDAFRLEVDYVRQPKPNGTGHAVGSLRGHVDDDFVLLSGDSVLDAADLRKLRGASGDAVGGRKVPDASAYGLLDVRAGHVRGIKEKPKSARAGTVNAGAYRFTPEIIARCRKLAPSPRGELELTDAITGLAKEGAPARFVEVPSWREAGRPWELLDLQAHVMSRWTKSRIDGHVGPRVDIEGAVVIEKGARVLNGCRLEGPVFIGRDARIGPNAYLRPGTSIGAGCHVGTSEIKNSILGAGTNVPHFSYVGDSVLGAGCNLGAGTQVANLKTNGRDVRVHWQGTTWIDTRRRKFGVVFGDGAKTGVNASLNPGTVLEPGAVVGAGAAATGWVRATAA